MVTLTRSDISSGRRRGRSFICLRDRNYWKGGEGKRKEREGRGGEGRGGEGRGEVQP